MALTRSELARFAALVAAIPPGPSHPAPGLPGTRAAPLSFSQLCAERARRVDRRG
jgi:hypothetical protein